ncbi:MAG TPA: hypothetical protein VGU72_21070 [Beijerinckiaceae bacterium]|jgi:hypothetical protein|nr:hypothetical protein [Beijerinckiaceae bacterium]
MQNVENFRLTAQAKNRILELCEKRKSQTGQNVIPAIMWIESTLNEGRLPSQVAIGLYDEDNRSELKDDLQFIDGLELVFAIPTEYEQHFNNKTLDFVSGKFDLA